MPVKIMWLIENHISYFRYEGDITIEEVAEASRIGIQMLEHSPRTLIHTIQDTSQQTSFPTNVGPLLKVVRASLTHPKMGWMVSVGIDNDLVRFTGTLVSKVTRTRHRILSTLPEALEFLQKVDATLPPLADKADDLGENYLHELNLS